MSLIQDALKRKTEEQQSRPATPVEPPPAPKQPAPPPVQTDTHSQKNALAGKLFLMLIPVIVLVLLIIGGRVFFAGNRPASAAPPVQAETAPELPAEALVNAEPVAAPAPVPAPVPEPKAAPEPKSKPAVKWPDLSYSGAAAGGNQILAIINGRMISIGGQIQGATVLQIGKTEVLVELEGEKRILRLDDE